MPRPRNTIPKFSVSRSGRAFCKVDGRFVSLGRADDPESRLRYAAVLQDLAQGLPVGGQNAPTVKTGVSVNELCLAFLLHAKGEYLDPKTGKPSAEFDCYKSAVKPLQELFGEVSAADFGPNSLRAVRQKFIDAGWSRGFINKSVSRVRHIWRWGVARELVPATVWDGLRAMEPLKAGKTSARETERRQAVPDAHLDAVREHLSQQCRDLFDLLRWTGARPAELVTLTGGQIDCTGPVWVAKLATHKNAHRGLSRTIHFGPQAQLILRRLMTGDDQPIFRMQRSTLSRALQVACPKAGVKSFTAYHLRHSALTRVRDALGIEAAQAIGGHAKPSMTAHYASKMDKLAVDAAARCG